MTVYKASTFQQGQRAFPKQQGEAPERQALEAESACGPLLLPSSKGTPEQVLPGHKVTTRDFAQRFTVDQAVLHPQVEGSSDP